jgi:hypothetical protein
VVGLTDTFKPVPDKRGLYAPTRLESVSPSVIPLVRAPRVATARA